MSTVMARLFFALLLLLGYPVLAEYGKGYVASEMDPVTHEFKPVYKDWQEGVVLDSSTGNYKVTYKDDHFGQYSEVVIEPATKIDPRLKSKFALVRDSETIRYQYRLRNGAQAKLYIVSLSTFVRNVNPGNPVDPPGWLGTAMPNVKPTYLKLDWSYMGRDREELMSGKRVGIAPGASESGFVLESNDLPGVALLEIKGQPTIQTFWLGQAPEFHSPIGQQIAQLNAKNFIGRPAAVPLVAVGTPYNAATVLDALRAHITKDIVDLKLIEPTLASELDRILQVAADAIRRNSIKAARDHLHDAFKLVHKAHPDPDRDDWDDEDEESKHKGKSSSVHPIDRLAARVIAFDLKYVEKRLK